MNSKTKFFEDQEKKIVEDINSRKIKTISHFFILYDLVEGKESLGRILHKLRNREIADTASAKFVTLLKWLEKENLIFVLEQHPDSVPIFEVYDVCSNEIWKEKPPQAKWLMGRLSKYQGKEIIPSPDLSFFVERDYKTFEQHRYEFEQQRYEREEARSKLYQILTIALAVISVVVSVWTVLTQNNERVVTIKNSHAFPDTTVVKITNHYKFPDTTKMILVNQKLSFTDSLQKLKGQKSSK